MSQQQPDPTRPRPRRATTRSKTPPSNGSSQPPEKAPARPAPYDQEGWKTYWEERQQLWRTEPEVDAERQEELAKRRAIVPDIEKGIYPFSGMKLSRADIEWLLATHENGRGPVDWNDKSQRGRQGLDVRGADLSGSEEHPLNLAHLPLALLIGGLPYNTSEEQQKRAAVVLTGANLSGAQLEGANLSRAQLKTANLARAQLEWADLSGAQLEGAKLRWAQLKGAKLVEAQLERADLVEAQLKGAKLSGAQLEGASLSGAQLEGASLRRAQLKGADLSFAQLARANLSGAQLKTAKLTRAQLGSADLSFAQLEGADLTEAILGTEDHIGPRLADIQWGAINLSVIDWSQVIILGDEDDARQRYDMDMLGDKKTNGTRLDEYQTAVRANRQLAVALQAQGLNEDAARFAYRANVLQRKVLWLQMVQPKTSLQQRIRKFGAWVFSHLLNLVAGYGYRPERSLLAYLLVIFGFMGLYLLTSHFTTPHLRWDEALVLSVSSFHGRGFFTQTITLGDAYARLAVTEAVLGLFIEISFIATFTQRFFGK